MNSEELLSSILDNSNYNALESSMNSFTKQYISKLLMDIILYVNTNISLGEISFCDSYHLDHELSQEIVGVPSAYSAMDSNVKVLSAFAEEYSHLGVAEYDALCKEVLLDFMNLHNGLFVVDLSAQNIAELSLSVPKESDDFNLTGELKGQITLIPVNFPYGTVTFVLLKTA